MEDRKVFPRKNWNIVFPTLENVTREREREREEKLLGKERGLKRERRKKENDETRGHPSHSRKGDCFNIFPIESVNDEIRALSPPVVKFRCSYFTHNDANLLSQSPLERLDDPSSRGTERYSFPAIFYSR